MVNYLSAGVQTNFWILDVFDCSDHFSNDRKKYALYTASFFASR